MPMNLDDWKSWTAVIGGSLAIIKTVWGAIDAVWTKVIPPFSSRIENGRTSDAREFIHAVRQRYTWATYCRWRDNFWKREFWTTWVWQKLYVNWKTVVWFLRKLRTEVDKPRPTYDSSKPEKKTKWKRPIKQTRMKLQEHLAEPQEVATKEDLLAGDIVYVLSRGIDYSDDPKHKFPLFQVQNDAVARQVEDGEYHPVDFDLCRYFWFKKEPRVVPALSAVGG